MSWKDNRRANFTIKAMIRILDREGIPPTKCLAGTGVSIDDVLNEGTQVNNATEIQVIANAMSLLPEKMGYGFEVGKELSYQDFGIWGLSILTSPNLRSAIEALSSFSDMSVALSHTSFKENQEHVAFIQRMEHLPNAIHRFTFERYFYVTVEFLREMVPNFKMYQLELHLPFSDSVYAQQLHEHTQLVVRENQSNFSIVAPKMLLDLPLPNADPVVHSHFVSECEKLLNKNNKLANYSHRIRNHMIDKRDFSPKLEEIARALMISERTLRRRLQEENQSFQEIVLSTKMMLARELILSAALPVKVVASKLNYSESASFLRAFKRWWGVSPTELRDSVSKT